ncbi:MAG: RnfABCDGE type electron transport complex subunit D [Bacillota bacterium]
MSQAGRALDRNPALRVVRPVTDAASRFLTGSGRVTSSAPHIVDTLDTRHYMMLVVSALMPVTFAAIYFFGWRALAMILVSYAAGGLTEGLFAAVRNKPVHPEGLLVTGLIFALILPPGLPLWVVAVGSAFGVGFGKEVFGGTGRNIFNPALVGRIFLSAAFPALMGGKWQPPITGGLGGFLRYQPDAITGATPLSAFRAAGLVAHSYVDLLLGTVPGSMGETFRLGIIVAGLFLVVARVSNWRVPAAFLGSVAVFSAIGHFFMPRQVAPPLFQLLAGGVLFGAFFMATDPVTSPFTRPGKWVFGVALGLLTVLIRGFSTSIEGVAFAIILMNAITPLIDNLSLKARYRVSD